MRQQDIEKLAAAAYGAAGPPWNTGALLRVLREVDPTGLYRPGVTVSSELDETQGIPLSESPRMLRPTRAAWPPGTPRAPRFPKLVPESHGET